MARTRTMVQLSDELVESLDLAAARRGVSRSALIRELVADALAEERRAAAAAVGAQIAAGYRRVPQAQPDEWGRLATAADVAAQELAHRLDAEERAASPVPPVTVDRRRGVS